MDVVCPLHGDSEMLGESILGYLAGKTPINRPSARHPKFGGGGISSVVRIRGIAIALAGRVYGRCLRALIDSGSTGNYLNARCQTALELEVKPEGAFNG